MGLPRGRIFAEKALSLALSAGWQDSRTAFSYFAVGRLLAGSDPDARLTPLQRLRRSMPGCRGDLQMAHVDMQLAAVALASGLSDDAIRLADRAIPVVRQYENYALLATLMLIKAEALEQQGETAAAAALRLTLSPTQAMASAQKLWSRPGMRDIASVAQRSTAG